MAARQKPVLVIEGEQAEKLWPVVENPELVKVYRLRTVRGKKIVEVYTE